MDVDSRGIPNIFDVVDHGIVPIYIWKYLEKHIGRKGELPFIGFEIDGLNIYFFHRDLEAKDRLLSLNNRYTEDMEPFNEERLRPYLKKYAEGFYQGYDSLEEKVQPSSLFKNTDEQLAHNIFARVFPTSIKKLGEQLSVFGAIDDVKKGMCIIKKETFLEKGVIAGEIYKAWELIIKNHSLFAPLFPEEFNKSIPEGAEIFETAWEAVLYYSVLVDKKIIKPCTKKDLPELMKKMMYKPDKTVYSYNRFYNMLNSMSEARKGIGTKEGKYTGKHYEAVENRLQKNHPEALSILEKNYLHQYLF